MTSSRCSTCQRAAADGWRPPIVATVAIDGEWRARTCGTPCSPIVQHAETTGQLALRRSARLAEELREIVAKRLRQRARQICTGERWDALTDDVIEHRADPWTAADTMLAGIDGA